MWRRRARSSPMLHDRRTDSYRWISKGDLYTREVRQLSATVGEHPDSTGLPSLSTPPESSYYTSCPTSASTVSRLRVFQVGSPMVRLASLLHCDTTRLRQAPEVRSAPCGPLLRPANPWSLLALDPKHGKARRRRYGRSLGIDLLLTYCLQSSIMNIECILFLRLLQEKRRAEERSRTAYPCSSYEFACVCSSPSWCVRKSRLFRRFWVIQGCHFVHCVPVRIREGCSKSSGRASAARRS